MATFHRKTGPGDDGDPFEFRRAMLALIMIDFAPLRELSSRQGGVVSRRQAGDLGVNAAAIRRAVRSGRLQLHVRCLLVDSTGDPDWRDAWALGLTLGPQTLVSGPTAMRLRGWQVPHSNLIAVVNPNRHTQLEGVSLLRDASSRDSVRGPQFRLAAPADALVDLLRLLPRVEAERLLDLALQRHWIDRKQWDLITETRYGQGHNGATHLRALGRRVHDGTHSVAERRLARLMKSAGLNEWIPNFTISLGAEQLRMEIDFALPRLLLCLEVDGRIAHSDLVSFERDRYRQNALTLAGWLVLRFTWAQITTTPDDVLRQIRTAMQMRESELANTRSSYLRWEGGTR